MTDSRGMSARSIDFTERDPFDALQKVLHEAQALVEHARTGTPREVERVPHDHYVAEYHTPANRIGITVKMYREAEGLTQEALAGELRRSQVWLSYIESGSREPNLDDLFWLSQRLGFSIDKALRP